MKRAIMSTNCLADPNKKKLKILDQDHVQEFTFADLKCLKVNTEAATTLKALRIRECGTFEEGIRGLASEEFCEIFRLHVNVLLIVIEVNELLDPSASKNVVLEHFKFDTGRPWIVQMTSTNGDSTVFFKDVGFSFVNIVWKKVEGPEQQTEEQHFADLVSQMYDRGSPHLSLLDFKFGLDERRSLEGNFSHKSDLCRLFLSQIAKFSTKYETKNDENAKEKHKKLIQFLHQLDEMNDNSLMVEIEDWKGSDSESLIDKTNLEKLFELPEPHENILFSVIGMQRFDIFTILIEVAGEILSVEEIKSILIDTDKDKRNILAQVAQFRDATGYKEVFDTLKSFLTRKEISDMIFDNDKDFINCWHNAVMHNSADSLRSFYEIAKTFLPIEERRKLFTEQSHCRQNSFIIVFENDDRGESFSVLVEIAKEVLTDDEIKSNLLQEFNEFNIMAFLIKTSNEKSVKVQFDVLREYLSHEEIVGMLLDVDYHSNNCLHYAANHNSGKFFEALFEIVKTFIPAQKRRELFISRGCIGNNIFHCAYSNGHEDILPSLLEISKEFLTTHEIRSMLIEKNRYKHNIVFLLAEHGNEKTTKVQFDVLRMFCSTEEIADMVAHVDYYGYHTLLYAATKNSAKFLRSFVEITKTFMTLEKRKEFFRKEDSGHQNIFFWDSSKNLRGERLLVLIEIAKELFTKEEIKSMLEEGNRRNSNVISILLKDATGFDETFKVPFEALASYFDSTEIIEMLFDDKGEDICLFAAVVDRPAKFVRSFFEFTQTLMSLEEQKKFFKMQSRYYGMNILQAVNSNNQQNFSTLVKIAKKLLTNDEIKLMLSVEHSGRSNITSLVVARENGKSLKDFLVTLRKIFTEAEMIEMFFSVGTDDINCLHEIVYSNYPELLRSYYKIAKTLLSAERLKELFTTKDGDGRNVFLRAFSRNASFIFPALIEIAEQMLTKAEIKSMLTDRDQNGSNILKLHVRGFTYGIPSLIEVLRNHFEDQEISEMMTMTADDESKSFIQELVDHIHVDNLPKVLEVVKAFLSVEQQRQMFASLDSSGRNFFVPSIESMSYGGSHEVFGSLLDIAKTIFTNDEIKSMFEEKDDEGSSLVSQLMSFESSIKDFVEFYWSSMSEEEFFRWAFHLIKSNEEYHKTSVTICEVTKNSSLIEFRRKIFKTQNESKPNVFFFTFDNGRLTTLVEIAREIFSKEEIKTMLTERNNDGQCLLWIGTSNGNESRIKELFEVFASFLSHEEVKEMIFAVDSHGSWGFHELPTWNFSKAFRCLLKYSQTFLSVEDQKQILTKRGRHGHNFFLTAIKMYKGSNKLSELIELASGLFTDDEIKSMLAQVLDDGSNIISVTAGYWTRHELFYFNLKGTIKVLLEILLNFLNAEEIGEMILAVEHPGGNFNFYMSAIDEFSKSFLSADKRREIFKMRSSKGNVLLCAIDEYNQTEFSYLLRIAKEILTDGELKLMLTEKNDEGSSVVSLSSSLCDKKEEFKELLEVLEKVLSLQEIREMAFAEPDSPDQNLLMNENFFGRKI